MATLKDEELKENFKNLTREGLEDYLIQLIRQLEELKELKSEKDEMEKNLSLAAELGKTLLENKVNLEAKLSVLEKELERKVDPKKAEELSEELSELHKNYEEEKQEWNKEKLELESIFKKNEKQKKEIERLEQQLKEKEQAIQNGIEELTKLKNQGSGESELVIRLKRQISNYERQIENYVIGEGKWENEKEELKNQLTSLKEKYQKAVQENESLENTLRGQENSPTSSNQAEIINDLKEARETIASLQNELEELRSEGQLETNFSNFSSSSTDNLGDILDQDNKDQKIADLEREVKKLKEELDQSEKEKAKLEKQIGKSQKSKQSISQSSKTSKNYKKQIRHLEKEISSLSAKNEKAEGEITTLIEKLTDKQAELNKWFEENKKFQHYAKGLEKNISELEEENDHLKDNQMTEENAEEFVSLLNQELANILNNSILSASESPNLGDNFRENIENLRFLALSTFRPEQNSWRSLSVSPEGLMENQERLERQSRQLEKATQLVEKLRTIITDKDHQIYQLKQDKKQQLREQSQTNRQQSKKMLKRLGRQTNSLTTKHANEQQKIVELTEQLAAEINKNEQLNEQLTEQITSFNNEIVDLLDNYSDHKKRDDFSLKTNLDHLRDFLLRITQGEKARDNSEYDLDKTEEEITPPTYEETGLDKEIQDKQQIINRLENKLVRKKQNLVNERVANNRKSQKINKLKEDNKLKEAKVKELETKSVELNLQLSGALLKKVELAKQVKKLEQKLKGTHEHKQISDESFTQQLITAKQQQVANQRQINALIAELQEVKTENNRLKNKLDEADDKVEEILTERDDLTEVVEKLELEKNQSKLAGISNAKRVETLQKEINEKFILANSLRQQLHDSDNDWKKKVEDISLKLQNTLKKLSLITSQQKETETELQVRTQERDNLNQTAQELSDNLDASQSQEAELNKQIDRLQDEINAVHEKMKEVETERNEGYQTITNHHKEKISALEEEREELMKKNKELIALHVETSQELERLKEEWKNTKNLNLEKEIKAKEEELEKLHEDLIILQNRLEVANDTISQQKQRIEQKNQQLTDLSNQLTYKDKLITDLQIEIANLKDPPTFQFNTSSNGEKIEKLQEQLREKDKVIEKLKSSNESDKTKKKTTTYSPEDLEKLIKEHQQEVQKLKDLIAKNSQAAENVQEVPVKEAVKQLPKKNNASLWLCLLGYSLATIALCFNLLKKLRSGKKN